MSFDEHHAAWSFRGTFHSVEYLKLHLVCIITDIRVTGKQIKKRIIAAPINKDLPILGMHTVYVMGKKEEDNEHRSEREERSSELRTELTNQGKRDEMSMLQPCAAPTLKVNDRTQYAFR